MNECKDSESEEHQIDYEDFIIQNAYYLVHFVLRKQKESRRRRILRSEPNLDVEGSENHEIKHCQGDSKSLQSRCCTFEKFRCSKVQAEENSSEHASNDNDRVNRGIISNSEEQSERVEHYL